MKQSIDAASVRRWLVFGSASLTASIAFSCSSPDKSTVSPGGPNGPNAGANAGGTNATAGGGPGTSGSINLGEVTKDMPNGPCMGLECQVPACDGNPKATTISGKVYDPAGKVPLYNVAVYVPNGTVAPLTEGASCDRCGASITNPVTATITDEAGSFKSEGVPTGAAVPVPVGRPWVFMLMRLLRSVPHGGIRPACRCRRWW